MLTSRGRPRHWCDRAGVWVWLLLQARALACTATESKRNTPMSTVSVLFHEYRTDQLVIIEIWNYCKFCMNNFIKRTVSVRLYARSMLLFHCTNRTRSSGTINILSVNFRVTLEHWDLCEHRLLNTQTFKAANHCKYSARIVAYSGWRHRHTF